MDVDHAVDRQEDRSAPRPTGRRTQPRPGQAAEERVEVENEAREGALDLRDDDAAAGACSDVVTGDAFQGGLTLPELHVLLGLSTSPWR